MSKLDEARAVAIQANIDGEITRDKWMVYGEVIAEGRASLPDINRDQAFGQWLKDNALDIRSFALRSKAMWLFENRKTLAPLFQPGEVLARINNPVAIYNRYRKLGQVAPAPVEPEEVAAPVAETERDLGREFLAARTQFRNAARNYLRANPDRISTMTDTDLETTNPQSANVVGPFAGDYGAGIYRPANGDEVLDGGGTLLGYARGYRMRVIFEEIDIEVWGDVPGISGWITRVAQ